MVEPYGETQMTYRKLFLSILILGVFATTGLCRDNPNLMGYPPNKIMGFRGLDTTSSSPIIPDGRSPDLQNVKLSRTMDLRKRYGWDPINESLDDYDISSPAISGIYDAHFSDGTSKIIAFVGSKMKYVDSTAWTEIGHYYSSPTITTGANYQVKCAMALDNAVCTNDNDLIFQIDSTPAKSLLDLSDLTNALTKAKTLIWYKNYLIFGNTVEATVERPTRFRWSDVGTTETYTDANYIDIASLGGDEIVGLVELYGDLYAFLKNSIWKISYVGGSDTFVLNKVVENIGAIARDSIQTVVLTDNRRAIVFLDDDRKVYMFNGASLVNIGAIIQSELDDLSASRLIYSVSLFDGDSYYLCATDSTGSENNIIYEFQTELGEWTKHTDINANAMARVKESTSVVKSYFGNYDAYVYWMDNTAYDSDGGDGDGITGVIESVSIVNTKSGTGLQVFIDETPGFGDTSYTGCIIKITSGTAAGEEQVIIHNTSTSLVVGADFDTTPDATSNYSIGAIDAHYKTRWFDFNSVATKKLFRKLYFWAEEASNQEVTISFAEDYGSTLQSTIKNLSPSSSSTWDSAIWDEGIWGTTGDKFYDILLRGSGKVIQFKFYNDENDESFHLYGYHILADNLGI